MFLYNSAKLSRDEIDFSRKYGDVFWVPGERFGSTTPQGKRNLSLDEHGGDHC